jgi:hypothetical protein
MDDNGIIGSGASESPQTEGEATGGIGRGRFLAAAGGAVIGLTALGGLTGTAEAAVAGPYFKPDTYFGTEKGETEADRSAAIQKADEEAAKVSGYVYFSPATYKFKKTLRISVPWVGVPRLTVLSAQTGFSYAEVSAGISQFVAVNAHFSRTFGSTADNIQIESIDWLVNTDAASASKGSIGFANVSGGVIRDCGFSTSGSSTMGCLLDLYACVQRVEVDRVSVTNLTKGTAGVGLSVRNVKAKESSGNTERIVVRNSYFGTTTGDEAISVYGVIGMTANVRVIDCTVEALSSSQAHVHIASTFPLASEKEGAAAGVEDVEWRGCRFIDTTGNIKPQGNLLSFGREGDGSNVCKNIRAVDCGFVVQTAAEGVVGLRNTADQPEGVGSANYLQNPRVDATGSSVEIEMGIVGFPSVRNPVILGKVAYGLRNCDRVLGGYVEAAKRAFSGCGEVSGVTAILTSGTAIAAQYDGTAAITASMRGCLIRGGQLLVVTASTVSEESRIDISGNRMIPSATSGEVVTNGARVHLRVVGNTISTGAALKFPEPGYNATTHTQSILNDWNGTPEGV